MAAKKMIMSLDPNSTMARAYLLMGKLNCSALPVALDGEIIGVLTLEDIKTLASGYALGENPPHRLTVGNYMKAPVKPVDCSRKLAEVIRSMLGNKAHAVVVKDGENVLGVLSKDNLLEILAELSEQTKATIMDSLIAFMESKSRLDGS